MFPPKGFNHHLLPAKYWRSSPRCWGRFLGLHGVPRSFCRTFPVWSLLWSSPGLFGRSFAQVESKRPKMDQAMALRWARRCVSFWMRQVQCAELCAVESHCRRINVPDLRFSGLGVLEASCCRALTSECLAQSSVFTRERSRRQGMPSCCVSFARGRVASACWLGMDLCDTVRMQTEVNMRHRFFDCATDLHFEVSNANPKCAPLPSSDGNRGGSPLWESFTFVGDTAGFVNLGFPLQLPCGMV